MRRNPPSARAFFKRKPHRKFFFFSFRKTTAHHKNKKMIPRAPSTTLRTLRERSLRRLTIAHPSVARGGMLARSGVPRRDVSLIFKSTNGTNPRRALRRRRYERRGIDRNFRTLAPLLSPRAGYRRHHFVKEKTNHEKNDSRYATRYTTKWKHFRSGTNRDFRSGYSLL